MDAKKTSHEAGFLLLQTVRGFSAGCVLIHQQHGPDALNCPINLFLCDW